MASKSILSNNIVYNLIGQTMLFVLSLVAVKFIFSRLGADILGIMYFTILVNRLLCGLLSKGICAPAVREVSVRFKEEPGYIRDFIRTGSFICWGVFLIASMAVFFGAPFLVENWINLKTLEYSVATTILRLMGIATLFAFPISFYLSLIQGLQKMHVNNCLDVAFATVEQLGIIIILLSEGNVLFIIVWIFCSRCLKVSSYLIAIAHFFGIKSLAPILSKAVIVKNSKFATNMIYFSLFVFGNKQADKVIVSKLLPISVFGYYGYIYELVSKALSFTVAVAQAAYPSFCELNQAGKNRNLFDQYFKLQDFVCFFMVPLFAAIPFMALPVLTFVFNKEIAAMLLLPLVFLSIGGYMNGTLSLPHRVLLAFGKPEIAARQYMYSFFISVPIIYILTHFWGLPGSSLCLVLTYSVGYFYMVPRLFKQCFKRSGFLFFGHLIRIGLLTLLSYGSVFVALAFFGSFTILMLISGYLISSILFIFGAYFLISDDLRKMLPLKQLRKIALSAVKIN